MLHLDDALILISQKVLYMPEKKVKTGGISECRRKMLENIGKITE